MIVGAHTPLISASSIERAFDQLAGYPRRFLLACPLAALTCWRAASPRSIAGGPGALS